MHFACVLDIPCSTLPGHSSKEMVPLASVSNLSKNAFMASSSTASKRHGPKSPRVVGIQPFSLNMDNLTNIDNDKYLTTSRNGRSFAPSARWKFLAF